MTTCVQLACWIVGCAGVALGDDPPASRGSVLEALPASSAIVVHLPPLAPLEPAYRATVLAKALEEAKVDPLDPVRDARQFLLAALGGPVSFTRDLIAIILDGECDVAIGIPESSVRSLLDDGEGLAFVAIVDLGPAAPRAEAALDAIAAQEGVKKAVRVLGEDHVTIRRRRALLEVRLEGERLKAWYDARGRERETGAGDTTAAQESFATTPLGRGLVRLRTEGARWLEIAVDGAAFVEVPEGEDSPAARSWPGGFVAGFAFEGADFRDVFALIRPEAPSAGSVELADAIFDWLPAPFTRLLYCALDPNDFERLEDELESASSYLIKGHAAEVVRLASEVELDLSLRAAIDTVGATLEDSKRTCRASAVELVVDARGPAGNLDLALAPLARLAPRVEVVPEPKLESIEDLVGALQRARVASVFSQLQLQQRKATLQATIDRDGDREGEFATLGEMLGRGEGAAEEGSGEWLLPAGTFDAIANGCAKVGDYWYALYLPGKDGVPILGAADRDRDAAIDPDLAETSYAIYAWPDDGRRVRARAAYFVDAKEQRFELADSPWRGAANPPPGDAAFAREGNMTRVNAPDAGIRIGPRGETWKRFP